MIEVPAIRTTRTRYPEELKSLAFELYAYSCGQDMPATIKALNERCDNPVSEKSVYAWRSDYEWDRRIQEQRRAMAPVSWELWCQRLGVAGPQSIETLSSLMLDPKVSTRDRITAARAVATLYAEHAEALLAMAAESQDQPTEAVEHTPGWIE